MKRYDLNGVPSVVAAESTAPGMALAEPIITPEPLSNSLSGLVRELIDQHDDAVIVIVDPNSRKVTAASGANGVALIDAVNGVAGVKTGVVVPDAGQTGRSLTWHEDGMVDLSPEAQAIINAAIEAAKPRLSVESLVRAILAAEWPDAKYPVVIVDQVNGNVVVAESPTAVAAQAAIDAVANAGDRVQLSLGEAEEESISGPARIFEGGATP